VSRRTLVILAVLAILGGALALALGAGAWWYWTGTPTYSLTQVQEAVRTHDLALFEKHVDVEGVTDSFVDAMIEEAVAPEGESQDPWERAGQAIGGGLARFMRPKLTEEARKEIRRYVQTGQAGPPGSPAPGRKAAVPPSIPPPYVAIAAVENVQENGKVATADVRSKGPDGQPLLIRLELRDMGGYWQVTRIVNAREVARAVNASRRPH
jgi:hypothetical protein